MTRAGERKIAKKEQVKGGAGHVLMEALLNEEERGEHCRIFSQVTIEPGCELGYHEHHGETETYYVLSGSATYMDNDKEYEIKTGDVTFCKDGDGHGIKNHGTEPIVFVALVLKKYKSFYYIKRELQEEANEIFICFRFI